jgi:hypothetical protein
MDKDREVMQRYPAFPARAWLANWLSRTDQLAQTLGLLEDMGLKLP